MVFCSLCCSELERRSVNPHINDAGLYVIHALAAALFLNELRICVVSVHSWVICIGGPESTHTAMPERGLSVCGGGGHKKDRLPSPLQLAYQEQAARGELQVSITLTSDHDTPSAPVVFPHFLGNALSPEPL